MISFLEADMYISFLTYVVIYSWWNHTVLPKVYLNVSLFKGLFIWSRVVPGRRVTLSPALSFTERLYEKVIPVDRAKTWPYRFKRLARVILKYLLWRPFLKSGTLKHRRRPFWTNLPPTSMLFWAIAAFAHAPYMSTCPWEARQK